MIEVKKMKYDFTTITDRRDHGASKWMKMLRDNPNAAIDAIPLSVADMEFKNAPEIVEGLKAVLDSYLLGYGGPTDDYYNAIISWMKRRHDFLIEKDWILTTPGIVVAINFILKACVKKGEGVILMTPVYYPFYSLVTKNELCIVENNLIDDNGYYRIDFDDLQNKAADPNNTALILCSPHNPIGRVWQEDELRKVADICLANDVLLIVDEIHHDLIMPGFKHHVLAKLNSHYLDKVITCTSCSKSFSLAGLQVSNIIIKDKELRNKVKTELYLSNLGGLNILAYPACRLAYDKAEAWLDQCNQVIYDNYLYIKEFVANNLPELKVYPLEGTYLVWIDCRALKVDHLVQEEIMLKHDLYLDEGFIFGEFGKGFERINIACPLSVIEAAMIRFKAAITEMKSL